MNKPDPADSVVQRAVKDIPRERRCLRCGTQFWSGGFGERICRRCKSTESWRNFSPINQGTRRTT